MAATVEQLLAQLGDGKRGKYDAAAVRSMLSRVVEVQAQLEAQAGSSAQELANQSSQLTALQTAYAAQTAEMDQQNVRLMQENERLARFRAEVEDRAAQNEATELELRRALAVATTTAARLVEEAEADLAKAHQEAQRVRQDAQKYVEEASRDAVKSAWDQTRRDADGIYAAANDRARAVIEQAHHHAQAAALAITERMQSEAEAYLERRRQAAETQAAQLVAKAEEERDQQLRAAIERAGSEAFELREQAQTVLAAAEAARRQSVEEGIADAAKVLQEAHKEAELIREDAQREAMHLLRFSRQIAGGGEPGIALVEPQ